MMLRFASSGEISEAAAEAIAGELGLFAEEVDVATRSFLGNTPLLFAHAEYVRAVMALAAGRTERGTDVPVEVAAS
jgi:GH15 family glucan-1,4-alpha-glucosidase